MEHQYGCQLGTVHKVQWPVISEHHDGLGSQIAQRGIIFGDNRKI